MRPMENDYLSLLFGQQQQTQPQTQPQQPISRSTLACGQHHHLLPLQPQCQPLFPTNQAHSNHGQVNDALMKFLQEVLGMGGNRSVLNDQHAQQALGRMFLQQHPQQNQQQQQHQGYPHAAVTSAAPGCGVLPQPITAYLNAPPSSGGVRQDFNLPADFFSVSVCLASVACGSKEFWLSVSK